MKNHHRKKGFLIFLAAVLLLSGLAMPAAPAEAAAKARTAAKTKVAVTLKAGSKKVNGKTVTLKKGGSQKITLSVKPKKKGLKVTWRSGKKSVVSVNSAGKLKAKKAGTAKITATVSGKKIKTVQAWLKVKVDGRSDSGKKEDGTARPEKPQEPAKPTEPQEPAKPTEPEHTCTISIDCITLAENLSLLRDPGQASLVPKDGWMLQATTVGFTPGDTVYDVLSAACGQAGYEMEASYTQAYGSYYVEGINGLYEFDGGPTSGWMYSVNGVYPPHASSAHTVSDGDVIRWRYTCSLGEDIGGSNAVGQ